MMIHCPPILDFYVMVRDFLFQEVTYRRITLVQVWLLLILVPASYQQRQAKWAHTTGKAKPNAILDTLCSQHSPGNKIPSLTFHTKRSKTTDELHVLCTIHIYMYDNEYLKKNVQELTQIVCIPAWHWPAAVPAELLEFVPGMLNSIAVPASFHSSPKP